MLFRRERERDVKCEKITESYFHFFVVKKKMGEKRKGNPSFYFLYESYFNIFY